MKKFTAITVLAFCLGFSTAVHADCVLGTAPTIPDGTTATEADMIAAQQAVRAYVTETQDYLSCLDNESRGKLSGDWTKRYNEASSQMERLASDFNKQLKAFKAR